jgi:glucose-6-phosphate 1-epimerase
VNSEVFRQETAAGGLERIVVETPAAQATVYLQGAHLALWQPAGEKPVLFMSGQSELTAGKPIRGGVPIIFPWFGPNANDAGAPMHGWARLQGWEVERTQTTGDEAEIVLTLDSAKVPGATESAFLRFRVGIGARLTMQLEVENRGDAPMRFEEALHTYFAVGDAREIEVEGLAGVSYLSKAEGMSRKVQGEEPIRITAETDRVYAPTEHTVTIHDKANQRRIVVEKTSSRTTVVWNPYIAKAAALPDFGDEEWTQMVCVETANAMEEAVTIEPGQAHVVSATITVEH